MVSHLGHVGVVESEKSIVAGWGSAIWKMGWWRTRLLVVRVKAGQKPYVIALLKVDETDCAGLRLVVAFVMVALKPECKIALVFMEDKIMLCTLELLLENIAACIDHVRSCSSWSV